MRALAIAPPEGADPLYKLGVVEPFAASVTPHVHAHVWARQATSGPDRLIIAPKADAIGLMIALMRSLPEPVTLLYVLLLSRQKEHATGRYQSVPFAKRRDVATFLQEYRTFFEQDGRHNLWLLSAAQGQPTLVYDQHNIIYAYGPLEEFADTLKVEGVRQSEDAIHIPIPHIHMYHPDMDAVERDLVARNPWTLFPLVEGADDK